MKPYICPQCGGQVNRVKMICEYCGTQFREEDNAIRIVTYHPGVHTLGANVMIDREALEMQPQEAAEFAIKSMARSFAEGIAQYMDVKTSDDPINHTVKFYARLRVLDSGYRL